jgi:dTDP-4-dehydrorhamnose 3,5-epimerase
MCTVEQMRFGPLPVAGAYAIELDIHNDERGFFARSWSAEAFRSHGLDSTIAECSISLNRVAWTLRGLHYQASPYSEVKLVRCTRGSAYDVVVDLRRSSPTFKRHAAVTISADNRTAVYVPEGCAHGFETLEDDTEVVYQINREYLPDQARGVRWDDSAFQIPWPSTPVRMSERDRTFADFTG